MNARKHEPRTPGLVGAVQPQLPEMGQEPPDRGPLKRRTLQMDDALYSWVIKQSMAAMVATGEKDALSLSAIVRGVLLAMERAGVDFSSCRTDEDVAALVRERLK